MAQTLSRAVTSVLVASATKTSDSNSGNLKDTANALPMGGACTILFDVTNVGADVAGRLDLYFDISPDGGSTWFSVLHPATFTASTGQFMLNFRNTGLGGVEAAAQTWVSTTSTATITNNFVMPPDHRIRWDVTGTNATATFAVYAVCLPVGTTFGG